MDWIITAVIGLVVGFIARWLKPGDDQMGWIMTAVLGIAGSLLANWVGTALGWYTQGQAAGWIASVIGTMALLFLYGLVTKRGV